MRHQQQRQQLTSPAGSSAELPQPAEPVDIFLTHVPANLRAKFGNARCRALLADQDRVQLAWSRLQSEASAAVTPTRRPPQRLPPIADDRQQQQQLHTDWYAILSEQFNSDYAPGVTATRRHGHNAETHGGAVFAPDAGAYNADNWARPHRLRRDDFSAYNEIIHVERKFNNQWQANQAKQTLQTHQLPPPPLAQAVKAQQQQQPTASILMSSGSKAGVAKRVTIEEQGQPGSGNKLHRANTVQRRED